MNIYKRAIFHFLLFIAVFFSIQIIINNFYISEYLLYEHLSDDFTESSVADKIENYKKVTFLQIIIPVIYYFLRFIAIASFVSVVLFFYNVRYSFIRIVSITILAEYIYIIKQLFRLLWFGLIKDDYTLKEFYNFNWDSIAAYVDISELEIYFRIPVNTVNLFTIFYVFVLAYFLCKQQKIKYLVSLKITAQAFSIGLFLWILLSMLVLIMIS